MGEYHKHNHERHKSFYLYKVQEHTNLILYEKKSRTVITWGWQRKSILNSTWYVGRFQSAGNVLHLNLGGTYKGLYIMKSSSCCTINIDALYCMHVISQI